jgi:hypothetical protein
LPFFSVAFFFQIFFSLLLAAAMVGVAWIGFVRMAAILDEPTHTA